jgi:hypothetical protein
MGDAAGMAEKEAMVAQVEPEAMVVEEREAP